MIRDFGFRELQLKSIRWADANERFDRAEKPHVRELGASFERTGGVPINPPVVRRSDKKLFSGHDRLAAAAINKQQHVTVHLMEGTDAEMREVALIENAYRRHDDRDALKRELVEIRAAANSKRSVTKPTAATRNNPLRVPGPAKSPEGVAREELAPALKTTPAALKQAAYRDRKKSRGEGSPAGGAKGLRGTAGGPDQEARDDAHNVAPVTEIETFGLPISDELLATVIGAQARLAEADRHMRAAQTCLTKVREIAGFDTAKAQELHQIVHDAAYLVRGSRPASLCPRCKGQSEITCMTCGDYRYVTAAQMEARDVFPAELLLAGGAAMVAVGGQPPIPLSTWLTQRGKSPDITAVGRESAGPKNGAVNGARNGRNGGVGHAR